MNCPFPGMDPYIERPQIWPDFHDRLITYIAEALQPQLRPRYAALTQDRLYVVEHRRPIRPDVSVVGAPFEDGGVAVAIATLPDRPLVLEIVEEEITQPVIHIIEPAAENRLVTWPDSRDSASRRSLLRSSEFAASSSAWRTCSQYASSAARRRRSRRMRSRHLLLVIR